MIALALVTEKTTDRRRLSTGIERGPVFDSLDIVGLGWHGGTSVNNGLPGLR